MKKPRRHDRGPGQREEVTPTEEELAILSLLALGLTDEVAARRLGLTRRTYRRRLKSAMDKLDARSRFQAGTEAMRRGWLDGYGELFGHPIGKD